MPGELDETKASIATLDKTGFKHWLAWLAITETRIKYLLLPGLVRESTPLYTRAAILVNFAKYLAFHGYAAGSISGYCGHVCAAHKDLLDYEFVQGSFLWKQYSAALTAEKENPKNAKHPVSLNLLCACTEALGSGSATSNAIIVAFFALLRKKEWSAKSQTTKRRWQFTRAAGHLVDHAQITVYRKGDGNKKGQHIHIFPSGGALCPLRAIVESIHMAPNIDPDAPVFQEPNGKFVRGASSKTSGFQAFSKPACESLKPINIIPFPWQTQGSLESLESLGSLESL